MSAGTRTAALAGRLPKVGVQQLLPGGVLILTAAALLIARPDGHYGLVLAVVPFVAAAVHGVAGTAVVGTLTVAAYVVLRHQLLEGGTGVWLIKLAFVAGAAVLATVMAQGRVRERTLTHTRELALALQEGLLPQHLPATSAVQVCHRYVPADTDAGVGGDWYDVIPLSSARVALVIGDVAGHGIHAAAMMGRLRTAVQTLADLDLPPDELLARLDDLVARTGQNEQRPELAATCLYLVYDPVSGHCSMSGAGQPPPALLHPDGRVEFAPLCPQPPLGVGGTRFTALDLALPVGTVITLYTDGLLDLRRHHSDTALDHLARSLGSAGPTLDGIADHVCASPHNTSDDDIALLLARTRMLPPSAVATWRYPATARSVPLARAAVSGQLSAWGLPELLPSTELAVSELVTNAVTHGGGPITVRLIRDRTLVCEVTDTGDSTPRPRRAAALDEGGRGLDLVTQLTDRWGTRSSGAGKTVWTEQALP
ncbi:ATP-binding SpoIIE family protein phosphatase [Streptacidiphilus sp. N1-10]|uniref:ATP-binding SpoIIE family protein phosphatase n=1 Tax=Streptacidiphilus jeojiensis TaxID=3229225 RepID=A0ABV6XP91_9ACTN